VDGAAGFGRRTLADRIGTGEPGSASFELAEERRRRDAELAQGGDQGADVDAVASPQVAEEAVVETQRTRRPHHGGTAGLPETGAEMIEDSPRPWERPCRIHDSARLRDRGDPCNGGGETLGADARKRADRARPTGSPRTGVWPRSLVYRACR
jgi:hypothetical protein